MTSASLTAFEHRGIRWYERPKRSRSPALLLGVMVVLCAAGAVAAGLMHRANASRRGPMTRSSASSS
jgi:hypothetical protein